MRVLAFRRGPLYAAPPCTWFACMLGLGARPSASTSAGPAATSVPTPRTPIPSACVHRVRRVRRVRSVHDAADVRRYRYRRPPPPWPPPASRRLAPLRMPCRQPQYLCMHGGGEAWGQQRVEPSDDSTPQRGGHGPARRRRCREASARSRHSAGARRCCCCCCCCRCPAAATAATATAPAAALAYACPPALVGARPVIMSHSPERGVAVFTLALTAFSLLAFYDRRREGKNKLLGYRGCIVVIAVVVTAYAVTEAQRRRHGCCCRRRRRRHSCCCCCCRRRRRRRCCCCCRCCGRRDRR